MTIVIHQAALGDWVLTFPLLRGLSGKTTVVTHWARARLAARVVPGIEPMDIELREFSRLHSAVAPAALGPAVREMFAASTLVVSFVSNGSDPWARNVATIAPRAKLVFVPPRPTQTWDGHIGDWHLHELALQGVTIEPIAPAPGGRPDGPVVIHPGSGGRGKCWPSERFAAVVDALRADGLAVQPILGEVEVATWPAAQLRDWSRKRQAKVLDTLDELADTIHAARLYIGNDAGPTHLAAQLGVPTLALFGPTPAAMRAPRGPKVTAPAPPHPADMNWLTADDVTRAAQAMLE